MESLSDTIAALKRGELVAVPTETVYGLAADALNEDAVREIFKVKGRPLIDPLIVHIHNYGQIEKIGEAPEYLKDLAEAFWPGPLTVIIKRKAVIPDIVSANLPTVGVRMPGHPVIREILKESGLYLAAPSANPFGYVSPTEAGHVRATLGDKVKHIVDGGPCEVGIESTILDISDPERPVIRRPGVITPEAIGEVIRREVNYAPKGEISKGVQAPGEMADHYSPTKPLVLMEGNDPYVPEGIAKVLLKRPEGETGEHVYWLSEDGDLREVGRNLFRLIQYLDGDEDIKAIYAEKPEAKGFGVAICDRLYRASEK